MRLGFSADRGEVFATVPAAVKIIVKMDLCGPDYQLFASIIGANGPKKSITFA